MTQWLQALTVWDVVGSLVVLGGILGGLKWLAPIMHGIHNFLADWQGEPERPGVPERPGAMAQIGKLRCDLEGVRNDLDQVKTDAASAAFNSKSNHGTSSHDAIMRKLTDNQTAISRLSGQMLAVTRAIERSEADRAEIRQHVGLDPLDNPPKET